VREGETDKKILMTAAMLMISTSAFAQTAAEKMGVTR
jgi:hypothetical protein